MAREDIETESLAGLEKSPELSFKQVLRFAFEGLCALAGLAGGERAGCL
jgi:hypothetical protein